MIRGECHCRRFARNVACSRNQRDRRVRVRVRVRGKRALAPVSIRRPTRTRTRTRKSPLLIFFDGLALSECLRQEGSLSLMAMPSGPVDLVPRGGNSA